MDAERNFVAPVVKVMGDALPSHQHLGLAQRDRALRLALVIPTLVNGELAPYGGEHAQPSAWGCCASFAAIGQSSTRVSSFDATLVPGRYRSAN